MHLEIVLGLLVFATLYQFGYTCSCLRMTVQQKYCDADFVMKVRVRSNLKNPSGQQDFNDYYRIRRLGAPWKFRLENTVQRKKRVYTASNGAMCGVFLQRGKKYLISGSVSGGKMRINLCGSIVERTRLSRSTKKMKKNPPRCTRLFAADKIKAFAGVKK